MVSPFLALSTRWHMMHAKSDAMGMTQRLAPFLNWLRVVTIDPLQGIAALIRVDLADSTLEQRQGIRTSLVLLPPPPPSAAPEPEYFAALPSHRRSEERVRSLPSQ